MCVRAHTRRCVYGYACVCTSVCVVTGGRMFLPATLSSMKNLLVETGLLSIQC